MSFANLITHYQPGLKAKLVKRIKLNTGVVFKKGQVSDFLINNGDGTYHFEALDTAFRAKEDEIELIRY